ncbi:MAG: HEAT repeat domain-containing protein [Candidatus Limiplasma sp.]|nr:HEAT repeat domain-containing protein [Candidatus Limiplasma sp.]
MRKVIGGFFAIILLLAGMLWVTKAYFFSIGYTQPLVVNSQGVSYSAKVEGKDYFVLDAEGRWQQTFLAGVDIGLGVPGSFPGEFAIGYDTYFDWFTQIGDLGANVIRVYTPQSPAFYHALYVYNRVAATPLYLMQGIYMDEGDVAQYGDVFAPQSITIADMRQDIVDCVNMLHGNAVVGAKPGKASGVYQYDVSQYVIGWILGIECEAYLVEGTNKAHPELTSFQGRFVYTEQASPFEVFIAQMKELTIAYETDQYQMQRPVAFSNWVTTDPLKHPNEPREAEDLATINVEHIKAMPSFTPGFFASYHVYPYYPDFLNFPSGDPAVDENPYYAYVRSLVDFHNMPVLISEFGLPTSRGVTHINHLSGLNQGGNSEQQQAQGLVQMLGDIHRAGCIGGIVFAWHDEWFKTSWNTMDFDDSAARPKWLNVQSNEENFGLVRFSAFPSIQIDGDDEDWAGVKPLSENTSLKANWDEAYIYLHLPVDDFEDQKYCVPIDTLAGEGNVNYLGTTFARPADFLLLLDGKQNTRLLVDPYYNPNYKLYGESIFSKKQLADFTVSGSGKFVVVQQVISNLMHMPKTGQIVPVQLWDTGNMRYGVSKPEDPAFDSMADFCAGEGFVELRIPWMALNVADPSAGKILSNLHTEGSFGFEQIQNIYLGLGKAEGKDSISMEAYSLPTWGVVPYKQRLKLSYYALQEAFPQYATYPISGGEPLAQALRLRDTRLLYVRIDRQIRNTDLITFFLFVTLFMALYLYILLLGININLNRIFRRQERERAHLLSLLSLPEAALRRKLHMRYLRTARGAEMLCRVLNEECKDGAGAALISILRTGRYFQWMQRSLASRDMMLRILIIRLTGLLQIRSFETQIIPLMKAHRDNLNLQYAGFLALSMMGNRDSIIKLCDDPSFTKSLSYRSLKEIFTVYTGDKRFLYEKLLLSPDAYIRRIVIKNIGEEGFREYAEALIPMLESTDINLLCDVIRTLGQLRCEKAGQRIAAYLQSTNWMVRNAVVTALAAIDAQAYRPLLMEGLKDREWWVRYNTARELCAHLSPDSLAAAVPTLNDRFASEILQFAIQEAQIMGKGAAQA